MPVTVLRRDQAHDPAVHRATLSGAAPTTSRLQRVEAALASETAARERAERALSEAQAAVRDLQTKIGHADLTKNEAMESLRREREAMAQQRADVEALRNDLKTLREEFEQLHSRCEEAEEALEDERRAQKALEKALKIAEAGKEEAERLVRTLSEADVVPAPVRSARSARGSSKPTGDLFAAELSGHRGAAEPEPVKWWLNAAPPAKKR